MFQRHEKILLALMAAINFTHIVDFMIMMPLGPQLMRIFQISPRQFGLLVSCYTLAAGCSGIVSSLFIDRFDRKKALLLFYTGFALGTVACAVSRDYYVLLAARSLTGVFGGVMGSLILSVVSDAISMERRGTALGIVMGAFSVASVLGVPFSLFLANHFDWHAPFMFLGVAALFVAILVSTFMPSMKDHLRGPSAPSEGPLFALKHILQSPNQLMALAFMGCMVFGQFSIIPFLSPSFVANGGMTEAQLPLIYLCGGIVAMIASPTFGRMADKFGKRKIFYVGAGLSIPLMLVITSLGATPVPVLLLISSGFFLAMSGRMVPAMAIVTGAATPRYRGSFMSVMSSVQQFSSALASYMAGLIVTKGADGRLEGYAWVGWNGVAFTLLALWLVRKLRIEEKGAHPARG